MSLPPGALGLPKFDNTLGAIMVCGLLATTLWGVTCVQTYSYFARTYRDPRYIKFMIVSLWLLDTFDSALVAHILYHYMVTNFLNPLALSVPVWSVIIHVAITTVNNFVIRVMFAERVWGLSRKSLAITGWILLISTTDLVIGLVITVKAFNLISWSYLSSLSGLMYANFATGCGSDISLTVALTYFLFQSRTGFDETDSLIDVLMMYTVNTGLIVAVDEALGLITYIVMPKNLIFLGFYFLLSKLYLNSYLATLNMRLHLRHPSKDQASVHLSRISFTRFTDVDTTPTSDSVKAQRSRPTVAIGTIVDKGVDHSPVSPTGVSDGRGIAV